MHILIGIGVLAGLLAFAFGQKAARVFVGAVLALGALLALAVCVIVMSDTRQAAQPIMVKQHVASVPARDLAAIWQRIEEKDHAR